MERGQEESHMLEHQKLVHKEGAHPSFQFKVIKNCKSSLERQVKEAVRIQLRGNVLNKKETYNRCKLTRMVLDNEWEQQVWEEAWKEGGEQEEELDREILCESKKSKRAAAQGKQRKKRKLDDEEGMVWGEQLSPEEQEQHEFLRSREQDKAAQRQGKIKVMTGVEWLCYQLVREQAGLAVELAGAGAIPELWEEWREQEVPVEQGRERKTMKEPEQLHRMLDQLDRKEQKKAKAKKSKPTSSRHKVPQNQKLMTTFITRSSRERDSRSSREESCWNDIVVEEEQCEREFRLWRKHKLGLQWRAAKSDKSSNLGGRVSTIVDQLQCQAKFKVNIKSKGILTPSKKRQFQFQAVLTKFDSNLEKVVLDQGLNLDNICDGSPAKRRKVT